MILTSGGIGMPDPEAPTRAVNDVAQWVVTVGCWAVVAGLAVYAVRRALVRRTLVPIGILGASSVAILGEPMWDKVFHLFWYAPGQWTAFTSFGIPQPWWVVGVYPVIYATGAFVIGAAIAKGATRQYLYKAFGVATLLVGTLETVVINCGVYTYYGGHPFEIKGHYPVWCAIVEGAHTVVFAVLAARIGPLLDGWRVFGFVPLFFFSFATVMYGVTFPALYVVNTHVSSVVAHAAVLISVAFVALTVWLVGQLLPSARPAANPLVAHLRDWARQIEAGTPLSPDSSVTSYEETQNDARSDSGRRGFLRPVGEELGRVPAVLPRRLRT